MVVAVLPQQTVEDAAAMAEQNVRLAYMVVHRFHPAAVLVGMEWDDLCSIATLALCRAARRFDPARGFTFSTYAVATITGEVQTALRDALPRGYRRGEADAPATVSLDARWEADEGDWSLADVTPDPRASGQIDEATERVHIADALARIPPREAEAVRLYWLCGLTQQECAVRMGTSQAHVSRLLSQALRRLRPLLEPLRPRGRRPTADWPQSRIKPRLIKDIKEPQSPVNRYFIEPITRPAPQVTVEEASPVVVEGLPVSVQVSPVDSQSPAYVCKGCGRTFPTPRALQGHRVGAHFHHAPGERNPKPKAARPATPTIAPFDALSTARDELRAHIAALEQNIAERRADLEAVERTVAVLARSGATR